MYTENSKGPRIDPWGTTLLKYLKLQTVVLENIALALKKNYRNVDKVQFDKIQFFYGIRFGQSSIFYTNHPFTYYMQQAVVVSAICWWC